MAHLKNMQTSSSGAGMNFVHWVEEFFFRMSEMTFRG